MTIKIDEKLKYWTPDSVAECLDGVPDRLYRKLWAVVSDLEQEGKSVPLGGDGSDGTIETPADDGSYASGRMAAVWHLFTTEEQQLLNTLAANI